VSYLPSFHHGLHRILSFIFNFVHIAFDVIIPRLSKQESAVVRIEFIEGREITLVWKGRQPIYVNKSLNHHTHTQKIDLENVKKKLAHLLKYKMVFNIF